MKSSDTVRVPVRFNLKKPEHAEIMEILKDLNKNYHTSMSSFIIEALSYYIRHVSDETITNTASVAAAVKKRDYVTKDYLEERLAQAEKDIRLKIYETIGTHGHYGMTYADTVDASKDDSVSGQGVSDATDKENAGKSPEGHRDLSKYDQIMKDIDSWV